MLEIEIKTHTQHTQSYTTNGAFLETKMLTTIPNSTCEIKTITKWSL